MHATRGSTAWWRSPIEQDDAYETAERKLREINMDGLTSVGGYIFAISIGPLAFSALFTPSPHLT